MQEHILSDMYFGFLGIIGADIVCSSGMLVYTLPPLLSPGERKIGHILNFFTKAPFRGKGYGQGLMEFIKTTAKGEGISRLFLNATEMGYPLYAKCGFVEPDNKAMQLDL
jgi:GNAT superfamily N-acetyltransferase